MSRRPPNINVRTIGLTQMEQRVYDMRDLDRAVIGATLGLSRQTVTSYLATARQKMQDIETLKALRGSHNPTK